jgi:hypothetical protein
MKKLFTFSFTVAFCLNAFSQITITKATHAPVIGDTYQVKTIKDGTFDYLPSGANQTWDFTGATEVATSTYNYINPSAGLRTSKFPSATIIEGASGAENYYNIAGTTSNIVGQYQAGAIEVTFTDEREFIKYPFTYGDEYNSTFGGTVNNLSVGQIINRTGTVKIVSDGYGTLKLPGGVTIHNALRVNTISTYSDTYMGFPVASYIDSIVTWYAPNVNNFVANMSVAYANGARTIAQGTYRTGLTSTGTVAVGSELASISPNPASGSVSIACAENNTSVVFHDALGAVKKELTLSKGQHNVNIENLSAGLYLVAIKSSETSNTIKLLVK